MPRTIFTPEEQNTLLEQFVLSQKAPFTEEKLEKEFGLFLKWAENVKVGAACIDLCLEGAIGATWSGEKAEPVWVKTKAKKSVAKA